ncbi:MAG: transketolase family protein [Clostridia bacterium]|nr:transketolase family protein [Clostridia bacterium]
MADKKATRESYGAALAELGEKYDFLVLDADLAAATKTGVFKKKFPERFFDCGIAEGNMISVAAGIATTGKVVFASSFAMFAAGRAYEQVRNSIGYPHINVKIGATHAGITVGEDGATHQCNEDIALMRTIPGMVIVNPSDANEAYAAVEEAIKFYGPMYLRFGRFAVPNLTAEMPDYKFELGKGVVMKEGTDVTIVATGYMVHVALEAAELLAAEGINAEVINIHTIKPLDDELLCASAKKSGAVVTEEDHNVIGGLGGAVCESLAETCPVPVMRVGVEDKYGRSGKVPALLEMYGLTKENIVAKTKAAIAKKAK